MPEVSLVAASSRRLPWGSSLARSAAGDPYASGAVKTVAGKTATAALVKAGLDWTVELSDVVAPPMPNEDGVTPECPVPGKRWARRSDTGHVLGILGPKTTILQNREIAEFADTLVETEASSLVGMGHTLEGEEDQFGTKVYAVVRLDDPILPNGMPEEATEVFLLLSNAFDSSQSFMVQILPMRLVCRNGLRVVMREHQQTWRIRHTATMRDRIVEARDTIQRAAGWTSAFQEDLERLLDIDVEERTDLALDAMLPRIAPKEKDGTVTNGAAIARRDNQREALMDAWVSTTTLGDDVRFTAYGAFNAYVEVKQWGGDDAEGLDLTASIATPFDRDVTTVHDRLLALAN